MAGRPKKQVESTENVNSEVETTQVVTNIGLNKKIAAVENKTAHCVQQAQEIPNVGLLINIFFMNEENKFVNGQTCFIPNVKIVQIDNGDGTYENNIVHINA